MKLWPHRVKLDLIFIHIHKTGGKSISKILEDVYGKKHFRINRSYLRRNELHHLDRHSQHIPSRTRVLSGHLTYEESKRIARPETKWITWLRDPVDRVISNYYWRLKLNNTRSDLKGPMSDPDLSLEQFYRFPENQNWMSMFLDGIPLESFFFIGFLESFDEDVQTLGEMMRWNDTPHYHINKNVNFKPDKPEIPSSVKEAIAKLNAMDMELYDRAKKLRKKINPL